MRIGICISGQFRVFDTAVKYFNKHVLDAFKDHECDIFIHTWKTNVPTNHFSDSAFVDEAFVRKHYQPAGLLIEEQKDFDVSGLSTQFKLASDIKICMSMYYSINKSFELLEKSGKKYDAVIRCRTDTLFFEPIVLPSDLHRLHIISDVFAISSQENMASYSGVYRDFHKLFGICEKVDAMPEQFVVANAIHRNIPFAKYQTREAIVRSEADCQAKIEEYKKSNPPPIIKTIETVPMEEKFDNSVPICILSGTRPEYLSLCLESIQQAKDHAGLRSDVFLIQDGSDSKDETLVQTSVDLFKSRFPEKNILVRENIKHSPEWAHMTAHKILFEKMRADSALIIEDDMIVSKDYFRALFSIEKVLSKISTEVNSISANFMSAPENHSSVLEWKYGSFTTTNYLLQRELWIAVNPKIKEYEKVLGQQYNYEAVKKWFKEQNHYSDFTGIDAALTFCFMRLGIRSNAQTIQSLAKHIGEKGTHCNEGHYKAYGFDKTTLNETDFYRIICRP